MQVANALISGVAMGAVYAMLAVGFSLLWQTSRTVNFAQGDFASLPAFFFFGFAVKLGLPTYAAAVLAVAAAVFVFGYLFRKTVIKKLLGRGLGSVIVGTLALSLLLENGIVAFWTAQPLRAPDLFENKTHVLGGFRFTTLDVVDVVVAMVLVTALEMFLRKTKPGNALRAVAQSPFTARVLGIDTERVITLAFAINAFLAAVVGLLVAPIFLVKFDNGILLSLAAFYAAVIGGFNEIRGAIVGGVVVGVIQALTAIYLSTQYQNAIVLGVLLLVILARPQGLLGTREVVEYK
ncbi:MAG: branched-chain amino acid ABC transporter permease [Streptosporangiales bacterium]